MRIATLATSTGLLAGALNTVGLVALIIPAAYAAWAIHVELRGGAA